jgi:hypothetical protein
MSSTLSVISLITKSKSLNQITSGEAIYRDKVTENNITFVFKQFMNARNDYNETLTQGDLVFFAGKFTVDEQKLFVSIVLCFAAM